VSVLQVFQPRQHDLSPKEIALSPIDTQTANPPMDKTSSQISLAGVSTSPPTKTPKSASLRILPRDKQAWDALLQDICPQERTQAQKMSQLLHWIKSARLQLQSVELPQNTSNAVEPIAAVATLDPRSLLEQVPLEQLLTVSVGDFLVREIDSARLRLSHLETERDSTAAALSQSQTLVQQLQAENHQLQVELD